MGYSCGYTATADGNRDMPMVNRLVLAVLASRGAFSGQGDPGLGTLFASRAFGKLLAPTWNSPQIVLQSPEVSIAPYSFAGRVSWESFLK